jgi:hypothetical protein
MIEDIIFKNEKLNELIEQNLYADAADFLFNSQINEWELMRENYTALKNVKEKSFWFDECKFKVQFNPERIKSTSADVSEQGLNSRRCFLCIENLPVDQKGILLNDSYLLLSNPYPVFPQHFTVSLLRHKPQRIQKNIQGLLEITKQLSKKYTLIYNGPDCGASAPDHLHFQAGTKLLMPIENDIFQLKNNCGQILLNDGHNTLSFINDGLRTIIFIEAPDLDSAVRLFEKLYGCYSKYSNVLNEPMMNLLCKYDKEFGFNIIIFLRSDHRPKSYYNEDPWKLMISPAAVDLGGIIISPREKDFEKLNKELIQEIISEVSLDSYSFKKLAENLKDELN